MDYIEISANIKPLELGREIMIAELAELGFESFVETDDGLLAYIISEDYDENLVNKINLFSNSAFEINYSSKYIKQENWNAEWEKSFNPINVENTCCIRAPFHDKIDNIEYDIVIDPKMSFGTGHHETTYLMTKRLLSMDLSGLNVLDMGCGTGILAILAKMKNAVNVEAIDIDEWAYNNTIENIRNNNCSEINVKLGGAELLNQNTFDLVIANINRNILIKDMSKYVNCMKNVSEILFSGFFTSDNEIMLKEASSYGLELIFSDSKNDWSLLHFRKV